MKGVPVRLEIGPRDIENGQVMIARRDTHEKFAMPIAELETELKYNENVIKFITVKMED